MTRQQETAILLASDAHYGKQTESFDLDIFRERLAALGERLRRIRELKTGYDFDKLIVCFLGDMNDGSGIFPGQEHYQSNTNVEDQANELSQLFAAWLTLQAQVWGAVEVEATPGNHGRSGRFAHEAANWDITFYRYLQLRLAGQIPVNFNDCGDVFVRVFACRGHRYVLYHGQDIRCYQNIPTYGIIQRLLKWFSGHYGPFDVAAMGHFHTMLNWPVNNFEVFLTGTMVTDDEWGRRNFGIESVPKWWLFGVSDSRPVTFQYKVDLA